MSRVTRKGLEKEGLLILQKCAVTEILTRVELIDINRPRPMLDTIKVKSDIVSLPMLADESTAVLGELSTSKGKLHLESEG